MFVKKLTLEQFGRFEYKSFNFCDSLNVIAGEKARAVFAALCVALCNRLLRFQVSPYCLMENSRIYAEIEAGGADYVSETVYSTDEPEHCETNVYCGRRKLTEEERRTVFHVSLEEEECSYFVNRYDYYRYVPFAELDYSKKLAEYRKALQEENRQAFSERTDGAGTTHTFRRELKKFCYGFLPQPIRLEKSLLLTMDEDGQPTQGLAEIIVAKHRNGAVDTIKLRFRSEQAKFVDWDDTGFGSVAANDPNGYSTIVSSGFDSDFDSAGRVATAETAARDPFGGAMGAASSGFESEPPF